MSLKTTAQYIGEIIIDEVTPDHIVLEPIPMPMTELVIEDMTEPTELVVEDHPNEEHSSEEHQHSSHDLVVEDLGEIPGFHGHLDPEKEKSLEVVDEPEEDKSEANDNEAEEQKPEEFVAWVKAKFEAVPSHSGYDSAGIERAISYLERLDTDISKKMRADLDGKLDSNKVEEIRAKIEDGIERLYNRRDKIKSTKKRKKKSSEEVELVKEAQKITGVSGIYVTVPLLISRVARVCVNGTVSAGHDIENLFKQQVKKYKLNDREQAEVMQLLSDMGFPLRQDRGYLVDEDVDETSSNNFDWNANYKA